MISVLKVTNHYEFVLLVCFYVIVKKSNWYLAEIEGGLEQWLWIRLPYIWLFVWTTSNNDLDKKHIHNFCLDIFV